MPRNTDLTRYGEMRLVGEYILQAYPEALHFTRMRLGALLPDGPRPDMTPKEAAMLGVFRRIADVVVITPSELVVIEASIRSDTGDPSKLVVYGRLVPFTPELTPYLDRRLVLELVVAIEDPVVRMVAQELGIRTRVFKPAWLPLYVAQLHRRERRPTQVRGFPITETTEG